jgi:hypothetical protein
MYGRRSTVFTTSLCAIPRRRNASSHRSDEPLANKVVPITGADKTPPDGRCET